MQQKTDRALQNSSAPPCPAEFRADSRVSRECLVGCRPKSGAQSAASKHRWPLRLRNAGTVIVDGNLPTVRHCSDPDTMPGVASRVFQEIAECLRKIDALERHAHLIHHCYFIGDPAAFRRPRQRRDQRSNQRSKRRRMRLGIADTAQSRPRKFPVDMAAHGSDDIVNAVGNLRPAFAAQATGGFSGAHLRELSTFARTIAAEEHLTAGPALQRALAKLQEQRELVASLREAPDYRPGRNVRRAVASAVAVVKRGRVLSAANEAKIRAGKEHLDAAQAHMDGVLASLDKPPIPVADDDKSIFTLDGEDGETVVLTLDDEDEVEQDDINAAIRTALAEALRGIGETVAEQTQQALARARGRVD